MRTVSLSTADAVNDDGDPTPEMAGRAPDPREFNLFRALDADNDGRVSRGDLERALAEAGLRLDDSRLSESAGAFAALADRAATDPAARDRALPRDPVCDALRPNLLLIERALQGAMVIPDFTEFCAEVRDIYDAVQGNRAGAPASQIPQLDLAGPALDRFGVALCTVDGQRYALGDHTARFSLQSTCKPVTYCLALEEHGMETVHRHVGHEPSGVGFNELTLDRHNLPHNPLINAGAIMCSALVGLREKRRALANGDGLRGWEGRRLERVMDRWRRLCGGVEPRFDGSVYLSERQTADRNFALAYHMREKGAFPAGADLEDVLDFYFQTCSLEVDAQMMSVVAATLANGGVGPTSGERIFSAETVQRCLSLMSSCGMYDYSGEFAFRVGLPAKSGVSGAIMIVVPDVMGICTFSPRLDENGNSVRGLDFCHRLVETFSLHNYDHLRGVPGKKDPRVNRNRQRARDVVRLIWAASKGDLGAIHHQLAEGMQLDCADYDGRTPLHLAAAEGRDQVVRLYIDRAADADAPLDLDPRDRWGGTPLDDAKFHGHLAVAGALRSAGASSGPVQRLDGIGPRPGPVAATADDDATAEMIWAASLGDLVSIRRLVACGIPLERGDYDLRTPLHLAAAEGHDDVVRYLLGQGVDPNPRDRWGGTPLSDARRHGHAAVGDILRDASGEE